jgi:sec-independent protein translocase protein TatC
MSKVPNEDFFSNTTMSFGEHLEELRKVLARAVIGLVVGFLIGLVIANHVVAFVQIPLKAGLTRYYAKKDIDTLIAKFGEDEVKSVTDYIEKSAYTFDFLYVEREQMQRLTNQFKVCEEFERLWIVGERPQIEEFLQADLTTAVRSELIKALVIIDMKHRKDSGEKPSLADYAEQFPDETQFQESDGEMDGSTVELSKPKTDEMVKIRVWRPIKTKVSALNVQEAFMIWLKAGFVSGVIISSPWVFFQIWSFVAAGLYPHEQKHVYIYLPMSLFLFLAGASLAFFFVFEPVIDFLFTFNQRMKIDPDPRISEWISFVLFLPLGFGIAFQLPLVMLFLNRLGMFTVQTYLKSWRTAVLFIFVLSMFLTPSDPISMLMMAVPLTCLYFFGILLCIYMPRVKSPFAEGSDVQ